MVYEASAANGAPDPACLTAAAAAAGGVLGECNIYNSAAISGATASDFGCNAPSDLDWKLCASTREDRQHIGQSWLGVRVVVRHELLSNLFPQTTYDLVHQTVMRIDPRVP
jgi:hypothetical protein